MSFSVSSRLSCSFAQAHLLLVAPCPPSAACLFPDLLPSRSSVRPPHHSPTSPPPLSSSFFTSFTFMPSFLTLLFFIFDPLSLKPPSSTGPCAPSLSLCIIRSLYLGLETVDMEPQGSFCSHFAPALKGLSDVFTPLRHRTGETNEKVQIIKLIPQTDG